MFDEAQFIFENIPFEEALKFFQSKVPLTEEEFLKLARAARLRAFTVANMASLDALKDLQGSLIDAIKTGQSLASWKKDVQFLLKNWDISGWRAETIYRTNLQTAYQVGRYEQMTDPDVLEMRPYWMYVAVMDPHTRPTHAAMNGRIFAADDPIWDHWYPPNDFNCFPTGTLIATSRGWERIETLNSGDSLIGGSGNIKSIKTLHINPFNGDLVRLSSKRFEALMTPNHHILTIDGWKRAESIKIGDILLQIPEIARLEDSIINVDKSDSSRSNFLMTPPRQRKSPIGTAFYTEKDIREKKIDPIFANTIVKDISKSALIQKMGQNVFRQSRSHLGIRMGRRIFRILEDLCGREFFSYILSSCRGGNFQFLGTDTHRQIGLLRLAQTRMVSLTYKSMNNFLKSFGLFLSSLGCINPLSFYSFSPVPGFNPKIFQHTHKSSYVDFPEKTNFSIRKPLPEIANRESFISGAPLNQFDSLDDFRTWAFSHCILRKVDLCNRIPYNGNIFNLSVDGDESYGVRLAVVHNCRCTVHTLSESEMAREGLGTQKGKDVYGKPMAMPNGTIVRLFPAEGFDFNPGKEGLSRAGLV